MTSKPHSEPDWTPAERVRQGIDSDSGEYGLQEDAHTALNGLLEQLEAALTALECIGDGEVSEHPSTAERLQATQQYARAAFRASNPASSRATPPAADPCLVSLQGSELRNPSEKEWREARNCPRGCGEVCAESNQDTREEKE